MTTNIPFELASFHDCYIHGISFSNVQAVNYGEESLHIDIDYIVGWPDCDDKNSQGNYFEISKAVIVFKNIGNVKMNLGEHNRLIDCIERVDEANSNSIAGSLKWMIKYYDGSVTLELTATEFSLELFRRAAHRSKSAILNFRRAKFLASLSCIPLRCIQAT